MLTAREREILQLLADGMSNADVAGRLFISQETVKSHVRHILAKLEADTRTHAVAIALRDAIIDLIGPSAAGPRRGRARARSSRPDHHAEQDERRRLALFLHDGPVQNLAGIALMLDAAVHAIDEGRPEGARGIMARRSRSTARRSARSATSPSTSSRSCCATRASAGGAGARGAARARAQGARSRSTSTAPRRLGEKGQVGLYQIVRESLNQAVRRGPPTRISVADPRDGGRASIETIVADNGKGERRRAALDAIGERAATLNGRFSVEQGADGGTAIHVVLPAVRRRDR